MTRNYSMVVPVVRFGLFAEADTIACDNDPLALLIAEEDGDDPSGYPSTDYVMTQCQLERRQR